ncbi:MULTISPECIES: CaiB/BaiF CoA transferase family protein [unclassified Sporolactobacillus]|uniref:CaiB/BaiF CoA transferase family protein n=1 Tax=unclassified Sporolactobacillus TaxID=2628533 RepID=UPI002367A092|nr:CaiB/BaiF CoA-transferase family protein [Sporolactobacillus sp. CQH2019]MDD9146939.1 CaiB/BaiF CoA-transferase family protein [Sporolactobacillus sp. CQH2019]
MKPLEGIKIVEMTSFIAAPAVPRVLGEWGADVIKIESLKGDPSRTQGGVWNIPYSVEENPGFDIANVNKRFVSLNLKSEAGKEAAYKILENADVLVTSFRTKALQRLGFSYELLSEKFPKLVFAQILGYGENGPEKDAAGFDATAYVARGGILTSMTEPGESPLNEVNAYGDFQAAMCLASGICAALVGRNKSGKGDKVTVSLHHTALFMMNIAIVASEYGNKYPKSRRKVANPFNNTYKSKDNRWFVFCAPEYNRDFNKVMRMLDRPDLIDNEKYRTVERVNELGVNSEIIDIISEQMAKKNLDELTRLFKENDLAFEKGYTPDEILEDEEAWANDCLRKVKYPTGGEATLITSPVRFKSISSPPMNLSKPLGYHTREVLKDAGYSDERIEAMEKDNVLICGDN